jgi:hypothetical protein
MIAVSNEPTDCLESGYCPTASGQYTAAKQFIHYFLLKAGN